MDADTVDAGTFKIRLNGIDAPETDQRCLDAQGKVWSCGVEATAKLEAYSQRRSGHVLLIEQAKAMGEPLEDPLLLFSALYFLWVPNLVAQWCP